MKMRVSITIIKKDWQLQYRYEGKAFTIKLYGVLKKLCLFWKVSHITKIGKLSEKFVV